MKKYFTCCFLKDSYLTHYYSNFDLTGSSFDSSLNTKVCLQKLMSIKMILTNKKHNTLYDWIYRTKEVK